MILDEQVLYALSPHVYPKPKEINPHSMKPKTKKEIIEENDIFHLTKRKSKLEVIYYIITISFVSNL